MPGQLTLWRDITQHAGATVMLRDIKGATGQRPCHGTVVIHRGNRPCDGTSSNMPGQRSGYGEMCQYGRTALHYGTIDRVREIWSGTGNWAPYGIMACTGKHAATGQYLRIRGNVPIRANGPTLRDNRPSPGNLVRHGKLGSLRDDGLYGKTCRYGTMPTHTLRANVPIRANCPVLRDTLVPYGRLSPHGAGTQYGFDPLF